VLCKRVLSVSIALLLTVALGAGVAAQGGPVGAGEPTTYVDPQGVEHGTVTVTEILDPYTGFPEDSGPEPGSRFVIVTLSFEGAGEDGIDIYTPSIWLQDSTGALWGESLPCCITDDFPEPQLTITTVGPGSRVSGFIGYTIPEDSVVQAVVVQPADGVILIPADLGSARPAVGTPVTLVGADEAQAVATVTKVEDPYKGFDKDRPPVDGARFVMVTASFENTGDTPFDLQTNGVLLRDARGSLWAPSEVTPAKKPKVPELESIDLGRGNLVTGRLGFQVPDGVDLEGLYFQGGGHLTRIAALSDAGSGPAPGAEPTCEEMTAWWADVNPLLQRLTALPPFQSDAGPMDLAASQAMLAELESIVADHLAITPPDSLVPEHRRVLGALLLYERSARDQVAAQEASDPTLLLVSQEAFEAGQLAVAAALAELDVLGFEDCEGS
jgi:hypothetical protein